MADLQPGEQLNFLASCTSAFGQPTIAFGLPPQMSERLRRLQADTDTDGKFTMQDGYAAGPVHVEFASASTVAVIGLQAEAFAGFLVKWAGGQHVDVSFTTAGLDPQTFDLIVTAPPAAAW